MDQPQADPGPNSRADAAALPGSHDRHDVAVDDADRTVIADAKAVALAHVKHSAGPGWPLRREWADPQRREQILFAARPVETEPSLIGFSDPLIAAATRP